MCLIKRRKLLVLCLLLFFAPLFCCYSNVVLTDEEATQIMEVIQQSQTELTIAQQELETIKKNSKIESEKLQKDLKDVETTYEEQKAYYEKQLAEEKLRTRVLAVFDILLSTVIIFIVL